MPTLRPIGHHTVESLHASNAIRRAILADARKPGGATTVDVRGRVHKVTVRNASRGEPTPLRSPDLVRAATRAAAPVSHATRSTPCTHLPKAPLSDDSWLRFVRHLHDEGRTPGAMHDDPATGVVYSTNARPRAVTSFRRQSKAQADLSPQPQADALASRRWPRALALEITPAARLSSASEDEGIGLGSLPGEPLSPASVTALGTVVARPNGVCLALGDGDVQAVSEDDGHGPSESSSPSSSDEEGSVWRGHWAGLDGWRLPPSARNVDVIRYGASLTEKTALPGPVPGPFVARSESGSSDGSLDDDIPESWLDDNEIIDHAAVESSDDEWEPEVIAFAASCDDIPSGSWRNVSKGREIDGEALPDNAAMPDVVEDSEEEDVPRRRPLSVDECREYRTLFEARLTKAKERLSATSCEDLALIDGEYAKQPSRLTFVGMDVAVHTDSNESLDEAETRRAYLRTKPGPGRRADLGPEYTVELASTSPWVPSGRKGILRTSSPLVSSILPPPALADTPAIEGDRQGASLRFSDDAMLASGASPLPPLASWVDDSSDEEAVYF